MSPIFGDNMVLQRGLMEIDGKEKPINQGEIYSGNIVVSLAK